MSTIMRESNQAPAALPAVGRAETLFGLLAIVIAFLALLIQFSGLLD